MPETAADATALEIASDNPEYWLDFEPSLLARAAARLKKRQPSSSTRGTSNARANRPNVSLAKRSTLGK
jgi:hypothetical protein